MNFDIAEAISVLQRTPTILRDLLQGLSDEWIISNEGGESFSPFDVVGHLIHGEKKDWIERATIIISNADHREFEPFDRFAMYETSKGKSLNELLDEFEMLRKANLVILNSLPIDDEKLNRTGIHPALGEVTLRQLLSTWVVHDLGHIAQITRVMSKQYKGEVGPWVGHLPVLTR